LKHHNQVIKWPDKEEHRNISGRIRKVHGFVNCIGVNDGTLFPLVIAPMVMESIIIQGKLIMLLKGWSSVMML